MKAFAVTLTEDEWTRVAMALGCHTAFAMRTNPDKETALEVAQQNNEIVNKITVAKYEDR